MNLFDTTINTLEHSLHYSARKNDVISNNIANVDTPNYKTQDVVFKQTLKNVMNNQLEATRTHPKHIPFSTLNNMMQTVTKSNTNYNHNGNNVDIDKEMSDLAKNQIYYRALIDRMNGKFESIQTVIRGG